jgi:hypothetical protein
MQATKRRTRKEPNEAFESACRIAEKFESQWFADGLKRSEIKAEIERRGVHLGGISLKRIANKICAKYLCNRDYPRRAFTRRKLFNAAEWNAMRAWVQRNREANSHFVLTSSPKLLALVARSRSGIKTNEAAMRETLRAAGISCE